MNIIHETDIQLYKNIFEKKIAKKLQIKKKCIALLKNGKTYNNCSVNTVNTCKKHEDSTNLVKEKRHIIYHNHLPFEKNDNCPLCVK